MSSNPRIAYILKMFPRLSETFVLNEIWELERQGYQVEVCSLKYPDDGKIHRRVSELTGTTQYITSGKYENLWTQYHGTAEEHQVNLKLWEKAIEFLNSSNTPRDLEFLLRALNIAASFNRDNVQHIHAHFATIATRMAATVHLLTGIPFTFTAHAKDIFRSTVDKNLFVRLAMMSEKVVTVSEYNKQYILKHYPGVPEKKIEVIYNGLDLNQWIPTEKPQSKPIRIVSVGRLVAKKGFKILIQTAQELHQLGQDIQWTVVGDGVLRTELESQVLESGLAECITFTGSLTHDRVVKALSEANLVALACVRDEDGNQDALPTVLLEALALNIPIVSTAIAGIPEIVSPEVGELVEPNSVPAMTEGIMRALIRLERGDWRNDVCRTRAETLFDLQQSVTTLAGVMRVNSACETAR